MSEQGKLLMSEGCPMNTKYLLIPAALVVLAGCSSAQEASDPVTPKEPVSASGSGSPSPEAVEPSEIVVKDDPLESQENVPEDKKLDKVTESYEPELTGPKPSTEPEFIEKSQQFMGTESYQKDLADYFGSKEYVRSTQPQKGSPKWCFRLSQLVKSSIQEASETPSSEEAKKVAQKNRSAAAGIIRTSGTKEGDTISAYFMYMAKPGELPQDRSAYDGIQDRVPKFFIAQCGVAFNPPAVPPPGGVEFPTSPGIGLPPEQKTPPPPAPAEKPE